jgi:hypothetical protein
VGHQCGFRCRAGESAPPPVAELIFAYARNGAQGQFQTRLQPVNFGLLQNLMAVPLVPPQT